MTRVMGLCVLAGCATTMRLPAPIAAATDGRLLCFGPHRATRGCGALVAYARAADGGVEDRTAFLVQKKPLVVARTTARVRVEGERVCGAVRDEDLAAATFTIADRPASAEETSALRDRLRASSRRWFDRDLCTAFVPRDGVVRAHVTLDGVAQGPPEEEVIWVAPADGWHIGAEGEEP